AELVQARTRELDAARARETAAAELYRNCGAMISHQFRTPLAIVDSALQRLVRRGDRLTAAEIRDRGDRARDAIKRMTGLIESTLDTARLDAGQIHSRSQYCDIEQLVADVCARQRDATPDQAIALITPRHGTPPAWCDPAHAEHILVNLLSNAGKYAQAGSAITVRISHTDHHVECAVINRGELSTVADTNALFERYYRGDNAKGHTGVGIGLYMARELARLQGGDVQLGNSKSGTVTFILRLRRTGTEARTGQAATAEPA